MIVLVVHHFDTDDPDFSFASDDFDIYVDGEFIDLYIPNRDDLNLFLEGIKVGNPKVVITHDEVADL